MLKNFDHVGFAVTDMERSLTFYRDLLGLEIVWERIFEEEYVRQLVGYPTLRLRTVFLRLPGTETCLELLEYQQVPRQHVDMHRANPGNAHLCIGVEDLDLVYEKLKAVGVDFVTPPVVSTAGNFKGSKTIYLHDPDGISMQLMERHIGAGV
jgi:catechol 2,3-dioxygenase-like lactoylglutathione lyase family enzyme